MYIHCLCCNVFAKYQCCNVFAMYQCCHVFLMINDKSIWKVSVRFVCAVHRICGQTMLERAPADRSDQPVLDIRPISKIRILFVFLPPITDIDTLIQILRLLKRIKVLGNLWVRFRLLFYFIYFHYSSLSSYLSFLWLLEFKVWRLSFVSSRNT